MSIIPRIVVLQLGSTITHEQDYEVLEKQITDNTFKAE